MKPSKTTPTAVEQQERQAAAVYRLRSADGQLLYVGSAYNPETRCRSHRTQSWWPEVASRTDEWHPTRSHAYSAEMEAIGNESPKHNVVGSPEYRETCRRWAQQSPRRQAIIRAGSAAGRGAPRAIVEAILRGEIKSYTKNGPVYFE